MKNVAAPSVAMRDLYQTRRMASLWLIERTDGVILTFTDHDTALVVLGLTYTPAGSWATSARRFQDGLRSASVDFKGPITADGITSQDLRAGLYRDAQITEAVVDWRYPWAGSMIVHRWWVDQVTYDSEKWAWELTGPERFLRRPVGLTLARNCSRRLGDTICAVNLASFTISAGSVLGTDDGDKRLVILGDPATFGAFSDEYFTGGSVTVTSGANAGFTREVRSYRAVDRRLSLQAPFPYDLAAGDTFDAVAGCDKTYATCVAKFSNGVRFGGFNYMPGADRVLQTPNR